MSDALVEEAEIQLKAQAGGGFGSAPLDTPILSGVSGTFEQDNEIVISGDGFSANRSGQLIYENFDNGVDGSIISDIPSFTQITGNTPDHKYKYASDSSFSGSKSAKLDYTVGDASGFRPQFDLGVNCNKVFVMMRLRVDVLGEPDSLSQIKLGRTMSISGDHISTPHVALSYQEGGVLCWANDGDTTLAQYDGAAIDSGNWHSFISYIDLGTLNNRDGSRFVKAYGKDGFSNNFVGEDYASVSNDGIGGVGANPANWEPTGNILGKTSSVDAEFLRYHLLPFYKRTLDTYTIYADQVFINDTLECVFVSPDATWSAAKANFEGLVWQPMNARAGDSISINCEAGNLLTNKYLYVLNSNGKANENGWAL